MVYADHCVMCGCPGNYECFNDKCEFHRPWTDDDQRLFPMEPGRMWYYQNQDGKSYSYKLVYLDQPHHQDYEDWEIAWVTSTGGSIYLRVSSSNPDDVWAIGESDVFGGHFLATPVEEGASWQRPRNVPTEIWTWHDAGTVEVPAGTFENCWRAELPSLEGGVAYTETWCRGIGRVASEYVIGGSKGVLVGTNFIPWAAPAPE